MSMFFILSGFVLGYSYKNGVINYQDYAFSRFSRIYPIYFLAALATLPWLVSSLNVYDSDQTIRYFFVIFSNLFMLQAWTPQLFNFWNDGGSWSLSVEMFFYALFPFLINYLKIKTNKQLFIILAGLYIATALPGISWILFNQNTSHIVYYSTPIYRLPEFIIGIICGLLYVRELRVPYPAFCFITVLFFYYCLLAWGPVYGFTAMTHNYATIPLVAICISCAANISSGMLYNLLANPLLVFLGRISYSFYSFQSHILLILITKHNALIKRFPLLADNHVLAFITFLALITLAAINYYFVENKFRTYLNKKYASKKEFQSTISTVST